ncbi:MAG: HAD family hydrolase [Lachnospiraceae bacterium]
MKRILAILGVILLLLMYASTMIFALSDNPQALNWAKASVLCTIAVPVMLYAFILVGRILRPEKDSEETDPKIDTVILDIGNVLASYDWQGLLHKLQYNGEMFQILAQAIFLSPDWAEADRGIRTEEEILQSFIRNAPEYENEIRNVFRHIGDAMHTFPYTAEWIQTLRSMNLKIYYLSNYTRPMHERTKDELSFLSQLDGGYMSYEIHSLKPEPEIYQKLIRDFHLTPQRCIFIDDCMDNVAGARAVGMKAIHFTGLQETMDKLNVLI